MAKSCKGLATELVKCLSESVCIKEEKRSFKECAGEKSPKVPEACVGLRETYVKCKRGQVCILFRSYQFLEESLLQVDMRTRIRGNKGY